MWQSEWATDLIFASPSDLNPIMNSLLNHAIITGTSTRILKYLDRPVTGKGNPDPRAKDNVSTRVMDFNDGLRVRHWVDRNSVKVYNEQNVLRVELTMNDSSKFKVYRHKQGQPTSEPKSRLPLRKGVADITLRAKVSQEANERFMKDLATLQDKTPVCQLLEDVTRSRKKSGKRVRAIDPTGKDRELLQAISDPAFRISGLTNKMIRQRLQGKKWAKGRTEKQLSARISRHLALLRDHGIIRKLPKQHRYQLTDKGVKLTTALNALLAASTEQLIDIAA
jgi:DNA-binding transcriptional ArsR family regulator